MTYTYCPGCNTHYVDTGCGQTEEHSQCPVNCGICHEPITGRDNGCQGHTMDEHRAFVTRILRQRES